MYQQHNSGECRGAEHNRKPHMVRELLLQSCSVTSTWARGYYGCATPQMATGPGSKTLPDVEVWSQIWCMICWELWPSLMKPRDDTERKRLLCPSASLSRQCTSRLLISLLLTCVIEDDKAKCFPLSQKWELADLELKKPTMGIISLIKEHFSSLRMDETIPEQEFHDTMNIILKYNKILQNFVLEPVFWSRTKRLLILEKLLHGKRIQKIIHLSLSKLKGVINGVHSSCLVERYNICVYDGRRDIKIFTVLGITSMWVLAPRAMPFHLENCCVFQCGNHAH